METQHRAPTSPGNTRFDQAIAKVRALAAAGYTIPQAQFEAAKQFNMAARELQLEMGRRAAVKRTAEARKKAPR